jgi:uncharacterized alkaline shock family protein YloU
MAGDALISEELLASYAADAARDVEGVRAVVGKPLLGRRGVRIVEEESGVTVEVHLGVDWGVSIPTLGKRVQQRVSDYLAEMADVRPAAVSVVVDEIGSAA